jgi:hypothetical protein
VGESGVFAIVAMSIRPTIIAKISEMTMMHPAAIAAKPLSRNRVPADILPSIGALSAYQFVQ